MERERTAVTALMLLLTGLWLSFFMHQSPRFAGSAWGGALGVSAALLMLVPLTYTLVKRIVWLQEKIKDKILLGTLLAWHVYASILGTFLAILHSGHKLQSWLGIALMTTMLLAIFSGYLGRHFLRYVALELRESEQTLVGLRATYDELATRLSAHPLHGLTPTLIARFRNGLAAIIAGSSKPSEITPTFEAIELTDAIAEMEYSVSAHEAIKRKLRIWLTLHIATSIAFYLLLILHIIASIQFGLRWFP